MLQLVMDAAHRHDGCVVQLRPNERFQVTLSSFPGLGLEHRE